MRLFPCWAMKKATIMISGGTAFSGGERVQQGFDYSDVMSQFRSGMFGDFDDILTSSSAVHGQNPRQTQPRLVV